MMSDILWVVYRLPLWSVPVLSVIFAIVWGLLIRLFKLKNNSRKVINSVLFIVYMSVLIYITLFNRDEKNCGIEFNPFSNFINARFEKDLYRSMLMNCFLFVPFGLFVPNFLCIKHRYVVFIVLMLFVSLSIEIMQYIFKVGIAETNDILCNCIGGITGSINLLLCGNFNFSGENNEY